MLNPPLFVGVTEFKVTGAAEEQSAPGWSQ